MAGAPASLTNHETSGSFHLMANRSGVKRYAGRQRGNSCVLPDLFPRCRVQRLAELVVKMPVRDPADEAQF
jgi:hypothetical protein